ncbi:MAG: antibiotic biosynthesis monooxygenase [Chlamydiales bacterium]|nr:antibiotic biosynthesis monooxygenase [Chlamydiales bacterium]
MQHTVIAILKAKLGKENQLRESLLKIGELTRQEDGCIGFQLYHDPENSSQFGLYGQWNSKEQYQKQFKKPYVVEFLEKGESLVEKPYQGFSGNDLPHKHVGAL